MQSSNTAMAAFGGFGYVFGKGHTYVTFLKDEESQCVEVNGVRSRTVPDLFAMDVGGSCVLWTLVRELEKPVLITP